jgi:hypothetical protein
LDLSLHPSEQKSLAGDPESLGTPDRKKPLGGLAFGVQLLWFRCNGSKANVWFPLAGAELYSPQFSTIQIAVSLCVPYTPLTQFCYPIFTSLNSRLRH